MMAVFRKAGRRRRFGFEEDAVLALVALLAASAAAALIGDQAAQPREERISRDFQLLVHGTGFGASAEPSSCPYTFDPRIAGRCPHEAGLVPLGARICPYHPLSVLPYRSARTGESDSYSR